jgi:hypothetical protein
VLPSHFSDKKHSRRRFPLYTLFRLSLDQPQASPTDMSTNAALPAVLLLQERLLVCPPAGDGSELAADLSALHRLGFEASERLSAHVATLAPALQRSLLSFVVKTLRPQLGDAVAHVPLTRDRGAGVATSASPVELRTIDLCVDPLSAARDLATRLLTRVSPLTPDELETLCTLVRVLGADVYLAVERVPVKETAATVTATLLQEDASQAETLLARMGTPTDMLRVLAVLAGADAGLTERPTKNASIPRALRRAFLTRLEALHPEALLEELSAREPYAKRLLRPLHPFTAAKRFPKTALAAAVLRKTVISGALVDAIAPLLETVPHLSQDELGRVTYATWKSRVELAFESDDWLELYALLAQRPGELFRRLDHLLRATQAAGVSDHTAILQTVETAAPQVSTRLLLALRAHLQARTTERSIRLFTPKGSLSMGDLQADERAPLEGELVAMLIEIIESTLLARAAEQPRIPRLLIDRDSAGIPMPFGARADSSQLYATPRGTRMPLPEGDRIRLFLHWTEPTGRRVDLDLSVPFYDANWQQIGQCDYTHLNFQHGAAVHSGDLTSAPAPHGATEYVDLDRNALLAARVRYLSMVVYSYNHVPFDTMQDAFAGFMVSPRGGDWSTRRAGLRSEGFDAAAVEQRFDLRGSAVVCTPMIIDLVTGESQWLDLNMRAGGGRTHSINGHALDLKAQMQGLSDALSVQPTAYETGAILGAARADEVVVREAGLYTSYNRSSDETAEDFLARVLAHDGEPTNALAERDGGVYVSAFDREELGETARRFTLRPQAEHAHQSLAIADLATLFESA